MPAYQSWGQYPQARQTVHQQNWRSDNLATGKPLLPYGQGRSYGDVCLNDGGTIVSTKQLDHFISLDTSAGRLKCEAGVTLADILRLVIPRGWFLSVTPGTKFVSLGGAIANDVHGKNHHRAGTFGCTVTQLELLRSDNSRQLCSPNSNPELFSATIGGLGLTGLITWAEIQLKPISSAYLQTETTHFQSIEEFLELSDQSEADYEYNVAWLDTVKSGRGFGRGIFMRANHVSANKKSRILDRDIYKPPKLTLPANAPNWLMNVPLIKTFNWLYYHRPIKSRAITHYNSFFYPLDTIGYWNRLYGARGLLSYQAVVPRTDGGKIIEQMLRVIQAANLASPLTVLKLFGSRPSPGLLSFPRPGINILLDFPNIGSRLYHLLEQLEAITQDSSGSINLSKDARVSGAGFRAFYPQWSEFSQYIDPHFSSSFWRRVNKHT